MYNKKKYSETNLQFGFTFTINNGLDITVCVHFILSIRNSLTKQSLLIQYLNRADPKLKGKYLDLFKCREAVFKKQRIVDG